MSIPKGTQYGGVPAEEIAFAQMNIGRAPFDVANAATSAAVRVPWLAGGYKKGRLMVEFTATAAGPVTLQVIAQTSDLKASLNHIVTIATAAIGTNKIYCAWDNGVWPGNWAIEANGVITDGSNYLNPTWQQGSNDLVFSLINNSGATITIVDAVASLGG